MIGIGYLSMFVVGDLKFLDIMVIGGAGECINYYTGGNKLTLQPVKLSGKGNAIPLFVLQKDKNLS